MFKREQASKVLIIENNFIIARDLELTLAMLGMNVTGITSRGNKALEMILRDRPHIVFSDCNLSESMERIKTAELIKRHFNLPIIFVTSFSYRDVFDSFGKTDPDGYVSKPFDYIDIAEVLENVLNRAQTGSSNHVTFVPALMPFPATANNLE
jgi:DNA-binding NarL/FixJ family response regulator